MDCVSHMHQESENMPVNPYLYPVKKLMKICKGPITFGHIHPYQNIKDRAFYVGSFTLLEANTEGCGYMIFRINSEDPSDYSFTRVINHLSSNYYKINIKEQDLYDFDIDDITAVIDKSLNNIKENDRLKLKLIISDKSFVLDKIMILQERYRNDSRVDISKKIINMNKETIEKKLKEDREKYKYILDHNMDFSEKMVRFFEEDMRHTNPRYSTVVITTSIFDKMFKRN